MAKLTKRFVDGVALPAKGDAFHWDSELKGFGLRANAAGKSFVVQGRIGSGRGATAARLTIGPYGVFTPDQARDVARERLREMRLGIDPRTANQRIGALRLTLREVADAYLAQRPLKPRTKTEINKLVDSTFKTIGWTDKPLAGITRNDVSDAFKEMRERAPVYANHAFAILRALFNFAIHEYVEKDGSPIFKDNPVKALYRKWSPVTPRTGRVPDERLSAVWEHLQEARQSAYNAQTASAVDLLAFLLLTGCRLSEATELTWDRVNLDEGIPFFHLPDPKNSNSVWLPLSRQAVELLTTRPTREGFVFGSWNGHITDPRASMEKVSAIAGCKLTPHDLRRTYTNVGIRLCKIEVVKVELLTNHVPQSVTARHYLETQRLQYLQPEVQAIADRITKGLQPVKSDDRGAATAPPSDCSLNN